MEPVRPQEYKTRIISKGLFRNFFESDLFGAHVVKNQK